MESPFQRELLAAPEAERLTVVCAWCRAVAHTDGAWVPLGAEHREATLSHGICPECLRAAEEAEEQWQGEGHQPANAAGAGA